MKKVKVSAALERKLRESDHPLVREVVALLDTPTPTKKAKYAISYTDILAAARRHIGDRLLVPASPTVGWTSKLLSRLTSLGVDLEQWERICARASYEFPSGPVELDFITWRALKLLYGADAGTAAAANGVQPATGGRDAGSNRPATGSNAATPTTTSPVITGRRGISLG